MLQWLKNLAQNAGKLHVGSDAVKILGLLAGVAFGVFGHDWQTGGEIALGSLTASLAVSSQARKVTNSVTVASNATSKIPNV